MVSDENIPILKYTSVRHLAIGETEDLKCGATTRWRRNVDGVTRAKHRKTENDEAARERMNKVSIFSLAICHLIK